MISAAKLRNKVDAALQRVGGMTRPVYWRVTTRTGGDSLLGRGETSTPNDVLLSPQPAYRQLRQGEEILTRSTLLNAGDYEVILSATSINRDDIENDETQFILKDAQANEEILTVYWCDFLSVGGQDVGMIAYARSEAR